jgi:transcriptional regulator with XRE-family HTH domain
MILGLDGATMSDEQAEALGDFLRTRRRRLDPEERPSPRRRRTPGLRREEIAEAAGIGVDWYTRLEQGRGGRPSTVVVDGLARALRLDRAEVDHLRKLAVGPQRLAFAPETAPPALVRMIERFPQPAYLTGRRWDMLASNAAALELYGCAFPNVVAFVLTNPAGRALFGEGWEAQARRMTAQFRVAYDAFAGDPAFAALVAELEAGCPGFRGWWEAHDVRAAPSGVKRLHHALRGWTTYEYATFQCNEDLAVKLTVYTPIGD